MILPFKSAEEDFAWVRDCADADTKASALIAFCKKWDLRDAEHASIVLEIGTWIDSPSDQLRQELVFALCFIRPVPGFEWVVIAGWKKASIVDLRWYATSVENSITRREQVSPQVVTTIAERLPTSA